VNVTQWHGCYSGSWKGILIADAFAHPAKFAPMLIYRILRHMLDRGYIVAGDSLIDPFGGIGSGGYYAMLLGLHWTGVELESRFVELGQRNIAKWQSDLVMLNGTLGTARLLQGDSRRLLEVVGAGMAAAVSSPPYDALRFDGWGIAQEFGFNAAPRSGYGLDTPGQLGSMPSGDYAAAVSSPPFVDQLPSHDDFQPPHDSTARLSVNYETAYGNEPGQLGTMKPGDFSAAVSSPPYADNAATWVEGPGARHDPIHHNGDNAHKISSDNGYGATPGNVGNMRDGGFEAAVSSPPYERSIESRGDGIDWDKACERGHRSAGRGAIADGYGASDGNIAADVGDTFWAAARAIVEQTHAALKPGGYVAWVCKDFVRKGQRVPFSDQWEQLCAAVGFEPVERIAAMLVDDHGSQLDIFGGATPRRTERKSFFRRLAEKKGSPRIDWEDVIIMRKPTRAHANGNGARSEP